MKKNSIYYLTTILFFFFFSIKSNAQNVGINSTGASPDNSAMLDIVSPDKGLLIPRMDSTSRKNIVTPAEGLMVFDSTYNSFYFYDGTAWAAIGGDSDNLGNHIATQNLQLKDKWLNNDGVDYEGISIDTNGYVGINLNSTPQGSLQVGVGLNSAQATINQMNVTGDLFNNVYPMWQSFTATDNVFLDRVVLNTGFPATFAYTLYEGEGTGGAVLETGTVAAGSPYTFNFNDIPLQINQKYTIYIDHLSPVGFPREIIMTTGNSYNGGTNHLGGDFVFAVYTKNVKSGLLVSETGVSFENYSFPNVDGIATQTLATNGAGTIGWTSPPFSGFTLPTVDGIATQVLTTNGASVLSWSSPPFSGYTLPNSDGAANQVLTTSGTSILSWSSPPFSNYTLPVADGTTNQVLSTDGAGTLSWANHSTAMLEDTDQNTKIQVEKNPNDDIIRFDINGEEKWTMQGNRLSNSQPNVFIGTGTGQNVTTGFQLAAVGDSSLFNNTEGFGNTAVGTYSLYFNTTGSQNVSIGSFALSVNTTGSNNIAVGYSALTNNNTGRFNTAMGHLSGSAITSGQYNTLIGYEVGKTITTGTDNVMLGMNTGLNAGNISFSTLIGTHAGGSALEADRMTALGYQAGYNSGVGGVYLGYQAGANETGTDKLYIDNSNIATPLIWGDFANDSIKVHGTFNINNAFSFPISDGNNGQVLATDGTGNLTWENPGGSAGNQTLSFSNDSIFISGANGIDISPLKDNLGNHTATQNIQLDTFWLSSDGGDEGIRIDNTGNIGFGRAVGTEGVPKFEYYGDNGSTAGPHIQVVNSGDDHPLFQQLNWTHDNISMAFDAYYNGSWISSSATSNYNFYKLGAYLQTNYSGGNSQGAGFTWSLGTSLDTLGRFGIGRNATTNKFEVEGDASKTTAGNWLANSDARLKKNITSLSSEIILEKMLSLQGVTYEWNDNKTNTKRPEGIQYGFTAQNIQEVFPTLVTEDNNGFLQTPYGTYDAMTVEAIRALNDKIEKLESEKAILQSQVDQLQVQNQQLKTNTSELAELKNAFGELKILLKKNNSSTATEAIESEE